ncbi:DUF6207 family protein [Streptomyces sp. NPDC059994]|uniref:DUF6207 family protein n=1 Tax=Streptomyces sp. NPDC059994 TaxID=3347029 RepID=UPI003686131C
MYGPSALYATRPVTPVHGIPSYGCFCLYQTTAGRTGTVSWGIQIDAAHISEPGLAVLDIAASDEGTARQIMDSLQQMWATSGIAHIWHIPGEPGVRARV